MTEEKPAEGNLAEEFRQLGKNLSEAIQTAWESPERKRLQQEIATELTRMGSKLKEEAQNFQESPTGQRLRSDVENVRQQVESSEVQDKVRHEILSALRTANEELEKALSRWGGKTGARAGETQTQPNQGEYTSPSSETGHQEVHPDDMSAGPAETGHEEVHPDDVDYPPPPGQ